MLGKCLDQSYSASSVISKELAIISRSDLEFIFPELVARRYSAWPLSFKSPADCLSHGHLGGHSTLFFGSRKVALYDHVFL